MTASSTTTTTITWARAFLPPLLPLGGALALAACGGPEEPTYEADVTDEGGGEMIVTDETPAVEVDLPETEMTMVPPEDAPTATPTPLESPLPSPTPEE